MKKFAKMSLVAAVAVAGLTSTASAVDLEQAIKGVDVSGQFRYRFNEISTGATDSDVEVEVTAKVPVNDNVTAVFKIDSNPDDANEGADTQVDVEDYYFSYVNGALTVNAGQQDIPGRITDAQQGAGAVALYNAGAFTVGAATFATHSISGTVETGSEDVYSVIAMGSVGPVSLLAQYALAEDVADVYNLKADVAMGPVKAGLEYTALEGDGLTATDLGAKKDERSTFKAYVSGSMDIVSAKLTYAQTGDNGSGSLDNQTTKNTETPAEFLLWNVGTATGSNGSTVGGNADMDLLALDVDVKVTDTITLRAAYATGEVGNGTNADVEEILGQISYKMSKNLSTYVRYSQFDNSTTSNEEVHRGRVEVKYTF